MSSFHKTMGYLSAIFLIMIVLSLSIANSYMSQNNINFDSIFGESGNLSYDARNNISIFDSGQSSSNYETVNKNESKTFDLVDEIFVSTSTEEVVFVEESRSDILVEYSRELPDTNKYQVDYKVDSSNNKLTISASMKSSNIAINKIYEGTILIHVPTDYVFDKITIDSGAAKITSDNIYTNTKSLSTIASFGDIDIDIDAPIEEVIISCSFGSIIVDVDNKIQDLDITCDLGRIELNINDNIDTLTINEELGDVQVASTASIKEVTITNSMGAIYAMFEETVGSVSIENSMGDIIVDFYDNPDISIYINTELGSIHSDFETTSDKNADFSFKNELGSIKVNDNE